MSNVDKICKKIEEIYKENERLRDDLELYKKVNLDLRKELTMLEKLIELNMKDLHDIADQRDWYYEEYRKQKEKLLEKIESKDIAIKDLIKKQIDLFEELQQWKDNYRKLWKENKIKGSPTPA
jgi:hypothetical protein